MKKCMAVLVLICEFGTLSAQKPRLVFPLDNPNGYIKLDFSADGNYALTATESGLRLWDVASGKMLSAAQTGDRVLQARLSPDGQNAFVSVNVQDSQTEYWDGQSNRTSTPGGAGEGAFAFSATGRLGYFKSFDGEWKAMDRKANTEKVVLKAAFDVYPSPANDFKILVVEQDADSDTESSRISWMDVQTGKKVAAPKVADKVNGVYWVKNNAEVLVHLQRWSNGSWVHTLRLLNHATGVWGATVAKLETKADALPMCVSGKGDRLFIVVDQTKQYILDFKKQPMLQVLQTPLDLAAGNPEFDDQPLFQFTPEGGLIVLARRSAEKIEAWDVLKHTKLWTLDGNTPTRYSGGGRLAFSPDGRYVLSGDENGRLQFLDARSGSVIREFTAGHLRPVKSLSFGGGYQLQMLARDSAAGQFDLASARFGAAQPAAFAYKKRERLPPQENRNTGARPRPGSIYVLGQDGSWQGIWDIYDAEDPINGCGLALKNLKTGKEVYIPRTGQFSWTSAVAFSPDNSLVLIGNTDYSIRLARTADGFVVHTLKGHTTEIQDVAISADNKYAVSIAVDRIGVKLWDLQKGAELATLYFSDRQDWALISPSGLFDASPGMMQQMYYVYEREIIELEQLKERYYEPGLLSKLMDPGSGSMRDVSDLGQLPLYPKIQAGIKLDQLEVQLGARSGGIGKLSLFVNDKEVAENINPLGKTTLTIDLKTYAKFCEPGANTLALRAYNSAGWLKSAAFTLAYNYTPPADGRGTGSNSATSLGNARANLYAVIVGTSDYSGDKLDLRFPDLDAAAMAQALGSAGKALFGDGVHIRLLTTDAKTPADVSSKKNIADAFAAYAAQAKPTDIFICYFSGHGLAYGSAEKAQFYYLTKDIASDDLKDDAVRTNYTVSSEDLTKWLTANPAKKQVMILDACNSGKAPEDLLAIGGRTLNSSQIRAFDRMKDRTGMFILTGSAADKVSFEASQFGQGLLTYSLLQGMSGLALTSDKRVDIARLFEYARDEVPELAKSIRQVQIPVLASPIGSASFDIGIVDANVKIPLAQVKPVFIRNNFQDEDAFDDELGLTNALAEQFQLITAGGSNAKLIYVDVNEYENAYSIKGRYKSNGDGTVTLRGVLKKGKEAKGEFRIEGSKKDLPGLVEAIIEKLEEMLE